MHRCQVCEEWAYGPGHQCPPQWNVWEEDEADEKNTDEYRLVYASDAEDAAIKVAHRMSDDGAFEGSLYVAPWGKDDEGEEQADAVKYTLEPRYELQFSAFEA